MRWDGTKKFKALGSIGVAFCVRKFFRTPRNCSQIALFHKYAVMLLFLDKTTAQMSKKATVEKKGFAPQISQMVLRLNA